MIWSPVCTIRAAAPFRQIIPLKIANLTSMLTKLNADVHVLMTENATNFINPITVCLRHRILIHIDIHRRSDNFLTFAGKKRRAYGGPDEGSNRPGALSY